MALFRKKKENTDENKMPSAPDGIKNPVSGNIPKAPQNKPDQPKSYDTQAHQLQPAFQKFLLGQILIDSHKIIPRQLAEALKEQKTSHKMLGTIFLERNQVTEGELMLALQKQLFISSASLKDRKISPNVLALVPTKFAKAHRVVPFQKISNLLCVAMSNCLDDKAVAELKATSKFKIKIYSCPWAEVKKALDKYYGDKQDMQRMLEVGDSEKEIPTIDPGILEHTKELMLEHVFLSPDVEAMITKIVIPKEVLDEALAIKARRRRARDMEMDKIRRREEGAPVERKPILQEAAAIVPISDAVFNAMTTTSFSKLVKRWDALYTSAGPLPVKRA